MKTEMIEKLKSMVDHQGQSGTWDYDPYMHGMFNGMELMLATVEGREASFRDTPPQWLSKLPQPRTPTEQSANDKSEHEPKDIK